MKLEIETILAASVLVAMATYVVVSLRTGNWSIIFDYSTMKRMAQRLAMAWIILIFILACAFLLRWINSFWFILVTIGGQVIIQFWVAALKLQAWRSRTNDFTLSSRSAPKSEA